MESTLQNHFLVAMPALIDSFFYRSVVYLSANTISNGAMGLIINRPDQSDAGRTAVTPENRQPLRLH